jgi:hypothetical protein
MFFSYQFDADNKIISELISNNALVSSSHLATTVQLDWKGKTYDAVNQKITDGVSDTPISDILVE